MEQNIYFIYHFNRNAEPPFPSYWSRGQGNGRYINNMALFMSRYTHSGNITDDALALRT